MKWKNRNEKGKKCIYVDCKICHRKHYAKGLCRVHYNNVMAGRIIQPPKCRVPSCKKKCRKYLKERLCGYHHEFMFRHRKPSFKEKQGNYKHNRRYYKFKKHECEICHATGTLIMHHKDRNTLNSDLSNLQTLCLDCHYKIHYKPL